MKSRWLRRGVLLLALCGWSIVLADVITLVTGARLRGRYLGTDDGVALLESQQGMRRIPLKDIRSIRIAFDGTPVCIRTKSEPEVERCDVLLHRITGERATIVEGTDRTQSRTVLIGQLAELRSVRMTERALQSIREGAVLQLSVRNPKGVEQVRGTVVSRDAAGLVLWQPNGRPVRVAASQLLAFAYREPRRPEPEKPPKEPAEPIRTGGGFDLRALVPGWVQFRRGDEWRAAGFIGGMLLAAGAVESAHRSAVGTASAAQGDPLYMLYGERNTAVGYLMLLQQNSQSSLLIPFLALYPPRDYLSEFQASQRNQRLAAGALALVYLWNVLDGWLVGGTPPPAQSLQSPRMSFEYVGGVSKTETTHRIALRFAF